MCTCHCEQANMLKVTVFRLSVSMLLFGCVDGRRFGMSGADKPNGLIDKLGKRQQSMSQELMEVYQTVFELQQEMDKLQNMGGNVTSTEIIMTGPDGSQILRDSPEFQRVIDMLENQGIHLSESTMSKMETSKIETGADVFQKHVGNSKSPGKLGGMSSMSEKGSRMSGIAGKRESMSGISGKGERTSGTFRREEGTSETSGKGDGTSETSETGEGTSGMSGMGGIFSGLFGMGGGIPGSSVTSGMGQGVSHLFQGLLGTAQNGMSSFWK